MDTLKLILSRRTVHKYMSGPVPKAVVDNSILAAIHAPNHKCNWPWRFYHLGPNARKIFADILLENKLAKAKSPMSETLKRINYENFIVPGAAIIFGIVKSVDETRMREDYAALACGVQNMALYLHGEGFGSKWITGSFTRNLNVFSIIGENAENVELGGAIWIGKPAGEPPMVERPPIDQFIKYLD